MTISVNPLYNGAVGDEYFARWCNWLATINQIDPTTLTGNVCEVTDGLDIWIAIDQLSQRLDMVFCEVAFRHIIDRIVVTTIKWSWNGVNLGNMCILTAIGRWC